MNVDDVGGKELRKAIKSLNASKLLKKAIATSKKTKKQLCAAFSKALESVDSAGKLQKVDSDVVTLYNTLHEDKVEKTEKTGKTLASTKKVKKGKKGKKPAAKKEPKERKPSFEQVMHDLISEGATTKKIKSTFTKLYAAKGKDDPDFVDSRIAIYKGIAERQVKAES